VIARVPELIAMARDAGMMVIHIVVAFREVSTMASVCPREAHK
jgi:hypothetical protein